MRNSFAKRAGVEYVESAGTYVQTSPGPIGYAPHEYEPTSSGDCDYCGQEQRHPLHVQTYSEPDPEPESDSDWLAASFVTPQGIGG